MSAVTGKRKRGRPAKGPIANKTETLTTRIREDTRKGLEDAATRSGRSLSQEVELRLRQSLTLETSFTKLRQDFGGPETFALLRMAAQALTTREFGSKRRWFDDANLHLIVSEIFSVLLKSVAPDDDVTITPDQARGEAQAFVRGIVYQVASSPDEAPNDQREANGRATRYSDIMKLGPHLKKWLGPLLDRLVTGSTGGKS